MVYYLVFGGVVVFCAGCITTYLISHKRTMDELNVLRSLQKNSPEKMAEDFYKQLISMIDLSMYENALNTVEIERQRIGADAHDEFAASLDSLLFNLQVLNRESHLLSEQSNAILLTMRKTIKRKIISFRNILYDMLPPELENGTLENAIQELCANHDNTHGTKILFRTKGISQPLTNIQKLNLYRIVQELLNNCLKHSNGWNIYISVIWTQQELRVIVKDTGKGIREEHVNKMGKYGVTGIFLRSIRIGAKAQFNRPPIGMEFELSLSLLREQTD